MIVPAGQGTKESARNHLPPLGGQSRDHPGHTGGKQRERYTKGESIEVLFLGFEPLLSEKRLRR